MYQRTMIVVADADASQDERDVLVGVIRAALEERFPERRFRFFGSEDRELTLHNLTSY